MDTPRSLAGLLGSYVRRRRHKRFTSREAVDAHPEQNAGSIRAYLQQLARLGRICSEPHGKENIYWEPLTAVEFGRRDGRMHMTQNLIDVMARMPVNKKDPTSEN